MNREDLNFKSAIFKIIFSYLVVYFLALIFKYNYDLESIFNNIQYKYLIALNIVSIFLGLPLSIIFDFMLLKVFGFNYVLFFSPALTTISVIQVLILRKIKFKFSRNILFLCVGVVLLKQWKQGNILLSKTSKDPNLGVFFCLYLLPSYVAPTIPYISKI